MDAAQGILTARGGMTSHAAVVARGMGKPCVAGCETIRVNEESKVFSINGSTIRENDWITLDGATGRVIEGKVPLMEATLSKEFDELMKWVDGMRQLKVRANADIPQMPNKPLSLGLRESGFAEPNTCSLLKIAYPSCRK